MVRWDTSRLMDDRVDLSVDAEIDRLGQIFKHGGIEPVRQDLLGHLSSLQANERIYLLVDALGNRLLGNLERWPIPEASDGVHLVFDPTPLDDTDNLRARGAAVTLGGGAFRLLVARIQTERLAFESVFLRSLTITALAGLGLGVAIGLVVARRTLGKLDAINRLTSDALQGDWAGRVALTGSADEFDQLAGNLNRMMDRIDDLMGAMRGVTRNIAHDLRTPLTRLRNRLEVALIGQDPPLTKAAEDVVTAALDDIDHLLATFNALLGIARIEGRASRTGFAPVPLARLIDDATDLYRPLAEDRGIALASTEADQSLVLEADPQLVFQALINLIDNAVKYCRPGDAIEVSAERRLGEIWLSVADTGPGIPPAQRSQALRPFVRLDVDTPAPGAGLGLNLVAAVAEFHRAKLMLSDNQPGLRVAIGFPSGRHSNDRGE
jgi:hypothetical protein